MKGYEVMTKGTKPIKTIINGEDGNPKWEILRYRDGYTSVTDLRASPMSDCCVGFDAFEAKAVGAAIMGVTYVPDEV
jgi:hypothetical protein